VTTGALEERAGNETANEFEKYGRRQGGSAGPTAGSWPTRLVGRPCLIPDHAGIPGTDAAPQIPPGRRITDYRPPKSPALIPSMKVIHSTRSKRRKGCSGRLESRRATRSDPIVATSTQLRSAQRVLLNHSMTSYRLAFLTSSANRAKARDCRANKETPSPAAEHVVRYIQPSVNGSRTKDAPSVAAAARRSRNESASL
jgi:hypothetical protein